MCIRDRPQHVNENGLDLEKLKKTVSTAMRMLDNVVDYNYYAVPQAKRSNMRHRPVGLGVMGFQDSLYKQRIAYGSNEAVEFADNSMEAISYYSILASSELADERGSYESFEGSLWHQGIMPLDSVNILAEQRGSFCQVDRSFKMDWDRLRQHVQKVGMRNSNCMALSLIHI